MTSRATRISGLLLAVLALAALVPAASSASTSATKSATGDGMTVTLTAMPASANPGAPVSFVARVRAKHSTGALIYSLAYGDGTAARPVAIPQYCLAAPGRPATETWHFTHRYRESGRYGVRLGVAENCGGEHAAVSLTVSVTAP